jgi:hypothetical protein
VLSAPFVGNISYFDNGTGDGIITLILAAVSGVLIWRRWYKVLWLTSAVAFVVCIYDMVHVSHLISSANNTFLANTVQLQWGWGVLLAGAALLFVTPLFGLRRQPL